MCSSRKSGGLAYNNGLAIVNVSVSCLCLTTAAVESLVVLGVCAVLRVSWHVRHVDYLHVTVTR